MNKVIVQKYTGTKFINKNSSEIILQKATLQKNHIKLFCKKLSFKNLSEIIIKLIILH